MEVQDNGHLGAHFTSDETENEHYTAWVQLNVWTSFNFTWVYFLRRGVRRNPEGSAPVLDWLSTVAS